MEEALSSACVSKIYHPDVEQGPGGKAPHLALWHDEGAMVMMTSVCTVGSWRKRPHGTSGGKVVGIATKLAFTVAW